MADEQKNLTSKPPVVVVLGHIDHGKTTLLDQIKKTNLAVKESAGITQHLGAYEAEVKTKDGKIGKITFLDTPGHEAFAQIRSRGAKAADLAILVVAADEGIKPQTKEALKAIKEAQIPFLIALNKIDKPNAEPERVKKELGEAGILIEEWGGKIPLVKISAKTGEGVDELLEMVLLMAEMEELKADPTKPGIGVVIETQHHPKKGNSALLLIQDGTLHKGKYVAFPNTYAPIRIFEDFAGRPIKQASFSSPVKVYGLKDMPKIGEWFKEANSKTEALSYLSDLSKKEEKEPQKEKTEDATTFLVLKADTVGSLEALEISISNLQKQYAGLALKIIRKGLGDITKDDLNIASVKKGTIILGFRVKSNKIIDELASKFKATIGVFDVIYQAIDWLKEEAQKRLPEEIIETKLGRAKVLKIFSKKKDHQIIGAEIIEGKIIDGVKFNILRRGNLIGQGEVLGLEQNKIKAKEVAMGQFGLSAKSKIEIAPTDTLEIFRQEKRKQF